jgi:hypothetical protein
MNSSIEMLYSYQAGERVINGNFPVYNNSISYRSIQGTSNLDALKEVKKILLNESDPLPVLSPTSTEYDPVKFVLKKDGIEYNLFK